MFVSLPSACSVNTAYTIIKGLAHSSLRHSACRGLHLAGTSPVAVSSMPESRVVDVAALAVLGGLPPVMFGLASLLSLLSSLHSSINGLQTVSVFLQSGR